MKQFCYPFSEECLGSSWIPFSNATFILCHIVAFLINIPLPFLFFHYSFWSFFYHHYRQHHSLTPTTRDSVQVEHGLTCKNKKIAVCSSRNISVPSVLHVFFYLPPIPPPPTHIISILPPSISFHPLLTPHYCNKNSVQACLASSRSQFSFSYYEAQQEQQN